MDTVWSLRPARGCEHHGDMKHGLTFAELCRHFKSLSVTFNSLLVTFIAVWKTDSRNSQQSIRHMLIKTPLLGFNVLISFEERTNVRMCAVHVAVYVDL